MKDKKESKALNSIISIGEIQSILKDYRIGKKPLAKLLGWGETTIIRYIEGDIPTNEYSDKLRALISNPCFYYDILVRNEDKLTSVAFKKSKKAVLERILDSKIYIVAQYIINLFNGEISPGYIQNLLYYVQGFYLAFYNEEMFPDEYSLEANYLPYQKAYDNYKLRGISTLEIDTDALTDKEKEVIENVAQSFGWYGLKALDTMIESEKALLKVSRDKDNVKIVSKETINAFFTELLNQYDISEPSEIKRYPDNQIIRICNLD